jgi:hypothetical protein
VGDDKRYFFGTASDVNMLRMLAQDLSTDSFDVDVDELFVNDIDSMQHAHHHPHPLPASSPLAASHGSERGLHISTMDDDSPHTASHSASGVHDGVGVGRGCS